jgi:hypothetical protein
MRNFNLAITIMSISFLLFCTGQITGCVGPERGWRYPPTWPSLVMTPAGDVCPDVSGKYQVFSEPVAAASESSPVNNLLSFKPRFLPLFFIPKGPDDVLWNKFLQLNEQIEKESCGDWFEIKMIGNDYLDVSFFNDQNVLEHWTMPRISKWKFNRPKNSFSCSEKGLEISGPDVISIAVHRMYWDGRYSKKSVQGLLFAEFTFRKASDGSLVMNEKSIYCYGFLCNFYAFSFEKWWKWLPLNEESPREMLNTELLQDK